MATAAVSDGQQEGAATSKPVSDFRLMDQVDELKARLEVLMHRVSILEYPTVNIVETAAQITADANELTKAAAMLWSDAEGR